MRALTLALSAALALLAGPSTAEPVAATPAAQPPAPVGQGAPVAPPAPVAAAQPALPAVEMPRDPVASADNAFFLRQASLQREIRLLELEARRQELRDEIAGVNRTASAPAVTPGGPIIPVMTPPAAPVTAAAPILSEPSPLPPPLPFVLLSIYGGDGVYAADFAVGAARVSMRRGGELPGGWVVRSIDPFEVVVQRGERRRTLRLGG